MNEREVLRQLSVDELVGIVLELQAKVKQLEDRDQRPPKTPDNSSIPSGQSRKANRPKGQRAKRGPKKGHAGTSRTKTEPDVVVKVCVETCAACGADLRDVEQQVVGSSQVVDLPVGAT